MDGLPAIAEILAGSALRNDHREQLEIKIKQLLARVEIATGRNSPSLGSSCSILLPMFTAIWMRGSSREAARSKPCRFCENSCFPTNLHWPLPWSRWEYVREELASMPRLRHTFWSPRKFDDAFLAITIYCWPVAFANLGYVDQLIDAAKKPRPFCEKRLPLPKTTTTERQRACIQTSSAHFTLINIAFS